VVTQGSNTRSVQGDLGKNEGPVGRLSGRESRFAQRPRSGPDLDALERPQRSWLVVRGALPLAACHVANGQAPLGGRVSGGGKAKPRRLLGLGPNDLCEAKSSEYTCNQVAQRS